MSVLLESPYRIFFTLSYRAGMTSWLSAQWQIQLAEGRTWISACSFHVSWMFWMKFSRATEYHHAMPLYVVLSENRCSGNHAVSKWHFLHFSSSLSKLRHRNCLQKFTESLRVLWKRYCTSGRNWFLSLLPIFFSRFWVKFGTRNLNIMLLNFFEFRPNRSREERVFSYEL